MPMRRPLSIVLVLLLVLRGLLGDAMAMGAAPVMGVPAPAVALASDSALHHHAPEIAQTPDSHERHPAHATEQPSHPSHTSHAEHSADCSPQAGSPAGGGCGEHEHGPN